MKQGAKQAEPTASCINKNIEMEAHKFGAHANSTPTTLAIKSPGLQCHAHLQASAKIAEGGDAASVSAVDIAKQVADQAMPTAERINQRIEKEAHNLSANAEFHASDVANEYQKGVKVWVHELLHLTLHDIWYIIQQVLQSALRLCSRLIVYALKEYAYLTFLRSVVASCASFAMPGMIGIGATSFIHMLGTVYVCRMSGTLNLRRCLVGPHMHHSGQAR